MLTIETGEDEYRIVDGDEEGDTFPYGETAALVSGGRIYVASLDSPTEPSAGFELAVYEASKRITKTLDVDFSDEGEGEDDGEREGEDDSEDAAGDGDDDGSGETGDTEE